VCPRRIRRAAEAADQEGTDHSERKRVRLILPLKPIPALLTGPASHKKPATKTLGHQVRRALASIWCIPMEPISQKAASTPKDGVVAPSSSSAQESTVLPRLRGGGTPSHTPLQPGNQNRSKKKKTLTESQIAPRDLGQCGIMPVRLFKIPEGKRKRQKKNPYSVL